MKSIKPIGLLLCVLFSINAFSQVKFGVRGGVNLSNVVMDIQGYDDEDLDMSSKLGLNLGLVIDVAPTHVLGFQTGLLLSTKGYKYAAEDFVISDEDGNPINVENLEGAEYHNFSYLEIPMRAVYENSGFRLFAGPYVAFGIGGSITHDWSFEYGGETIKSSDFYEKSEYQYKPVFSGISAEDYADVVDDNDVVFNALDFGISFGMGYELDNILLDLSYSLGIGNMIPDLSFGGGSSDEINNRVLSFSIAYFFEGNKG